VGDLFFLDIHDATTWYVGGAAAVGLLVVLWLRRWLRNAEERRKRHVERLRRFESVRTDSPVDNPLEEARERGIESIETRFTVIRRLLLPTFALLWLLLLLVPLLSRLPAAFISFFLGLFTVVVGIAARPFIENVIAGLVLSFSQPLRIGDTVKIDEKYGTVEDISLTHTTIKIWDWRRYILPNQTMLSKPVTNYSITDRYVWAYVEFWVSYDADLAQVQEVAVNGVLSSKHFAPHEPPAFWVMGLEKESIKCWVAGWADTPSAAWSLRHDTSTYLVERLKEQGIRPLVYAHHVEGDRAVPFVPPSDDAN
jgi:small-conductance mechanosensitive channel